MPRRTRRDGPRPIDPNEKKHRIVPTLTLTTSELVFLASLADEHGESEASILKRGLNLLKTLGELGCTTTMTLKPIGDDTVATRILLGIDLSRGLVSPEEYPNLVQPDQATE